MIPCRNLKLEILIPDPTLTYFVIERDEIEGPMLIAPRYIEGSVGVEDETYDLPQRSYSWGDYKAMPLANLERLKWNEQCQDIRVWREVKEGDDVCDDTDVDGNPECENGYCWTDIISNSTEINIERGFDLNQSVVGRPETGVLIADIADPTLNALQASGLGIGHKARLRVVQGDYSEVIFQGVVRAISSYNNAVDVPMVYLEVADSIAQLNGVLIDQGRPQETYAERVAYAVSTVPELNIDVSEGTQTLNETIEPLTALEMIVESQDSEGSVVWVDKENQMFSTNRDWEDTVFGNNRFSNIPQYAFTNHLTGELPTRVAEEQVCLSGFVQTSDTKQVINGITFYNYEVEVSTDNEGNEEKREVANTYTFTDNASARLYGSADIRLTTRLDPNSLASYAEYIFDHWSRPKTKVETIEWPADKFDNPNIPGTISLDIGDAVRVALEDPIKENFLMVDSVQRISRIKHKITPYEWVMTTELL